MTHIGVQHGLSDPNVVALFEDSRGVLWIATTTRIHRYVDGRLSRAFGPEDGVAANLVVSFAEDRDGRIWIGSNAFGLSVYEDDRIGVGANSLAIVGASAPDAGQCDTSDAGPCDPIKDVRVVQTHAAREFT